MKKQWWHDKVAYQIYPKSFMDSNGDGIGDLRGIISKLDYLKELGIDILWLSPIYRSPLVDQGYDISDYYAIGEQFGTMEEFDELIAETKKRNMYVLMDLVVNHCSSEHEWFKKAMADPDGEYGDYFYIRESKDGHPINNARSYFGGNIWEPIPGTNKYYLHMFAKEQPDLNLENPKVRQEIYKMVNWWLDKGLAGFRIDAIINIKKNLDFPMLEPDGMDGLAFCTKILGSKEGVSEMLDELKRETFDKHGAFTVGEVFNITDDDLADFIGENGYFSTIFDFSTELLSAGEHGWYDAPDVSFPAWKKAIFHAQEQAYDCGFESNIIENHDEPRGASRYLPAYARNAAATKMLGTMSLLLRGLPFIFQGQEIGMTNTNWRSVDEFDDLNTVDQYQLALKAGLSQQEALKKIGRLSRDNARTPMQWNNTDNGGFTSGIPWLRLNDNYPEINVENQEKDADSVLNYYKKLIALRKSDAYKDTFTYGKTIPVFSEKEMLMAYCRESKIQRILVLGNFGEKEELLHLSTEPKKLLLSNMNRTDIGQDILLAPQESAVVLL